MFEGKGREEIRQVPSENEDNILKQSCLLWQEMTHCEDNLKTLTCQFVCTVR